MISIQKFEPDKHCEYKCIYYRNDNGSIIRRALIDQNNSIVKDYLYELNERNKVISITLFGPDHSSIMAIKNYYYYDEKLSYHIQKTEEYKLTEGEPVLTHRAEHVYEGDDKCIVTLYADTDEPIGYELYGYRSGDDFMSLIGCFDMNDQRVSFMDFKYERFF